MLELLIKNGAVVNHIDSSTNRIPLVKSIITNHDDDSDDINPFAQYLFEYPNTDIEDEILEPVYKS